VWTGNSSVPKQDDEGTGLGFNDADGRVVGRDRQHSKQSSHEEGHE